MDLNPDQLIALGRLRENDLAARALRTLSRFIQRSATVTVALDAEMANRIKARGANRGTLIIVPPWSATHQLSGERMSGSEFRREHGLGESLVVMYSGNHSPSNPLDTLLQTAVALKDNDSLRFLFVGGGTGKKAVAETIERNALTNIISLPYQPREKLADSLAAADIHVVSLGENMSGVIHPSKVYSAMAAGRPVLYLGPSNSSIANLIRDKQIGWRLAHGDREGAIRLLTALAGQPRSALSAIGSRAAELFNVQFEPRVLCQRVADAVERAFSRTS